MAWYGDGVVWRGVVWCGVADLALLARRDDAQTVYELVEVVRDEDDGAVGRDILCPDHIHLGNEDGQHRVQEHASRVEANVAEVLDERPDQ